MSDLGAQLQLGGRQVLVVGGPARALGLLGRLLDRGARVTVVAPQVATSIQDLAERHALTWHARAYTATDLDGIALLVVCPGSDDEPELRDSLQRAAADANTADILIAELETRPGTLREPAAATAGGPGSVALVGGGPGDPGLITVAGLAAVHGADVLVVDRLAPLEVLRDLPPHVEVIDVAKIPRGRFTPQERINEVLIEHARAGKRVVRLKGGDSFVFGRGMEEVIACREADIPVEVVPGVTSAVAAPELAGIPVTHRGVVQGFAVVSGHAAPDDPRSTVDWAALAASGVTIVILMGVETLPRIAATLLAGGRAAQTPVACVMEAASARQRVVSTTVGALAREGTPDGIAPPAVTVIGDVAAFAVP
ncbi:uroporphyrin-III C-methyltransferase [Kineosphaera limosa]|uniref:uroporphyrinogen-III C-methyltransferase n=1 Tax=Kineosphaera limosa NBRC 100340 TaxID=1184609 RepID=K6WCC1_9MICO|nr:uroporphyrinogen-III C-methyltransferase [Kineosphaera limosa]NYD99056.1 uroporphyrin-III C-methyltransferase [Kineosphaera limosa]GAB96910.1 siroheme synthase CysG [Kineosphaera limosa NBRC 100340]